MSQVQWLVQPLTRRYFRIAAQLALAVCVAAFGGVNAVSATAGAGNQDTVTFTFALPDGAKARVVTVIRRTVAVDDAKEEEAPVQVEHRLEFRTTPTGVIIRQTPQLGKNADWMKTSASVQAMADGLIGASDLTFRFDRSGRYQGSSGLGTALEQMRDRVPPELRVVFNQAGSFAASQIEEMWRARFTPFLGRPFPVGKFGSVSAPSQIAPGTTVDGTTEIGVQERTVYQGRELVKTMAGWTTKDPRFGKFMSDFLVGSIRKMLQSTKDSRAPTALAALKAANPQIQMEQFWFVNEQTIDPNTMVTYYETLTRAFRGTVSAEGTTARIAVRQVNALTYEYQR